MPERISIPPAPSVEGGDFNIVGAGLAMTRVRMQVQRLGPHFRTVVIRGEAGTGKTLVARALHRLSQGAAGPFVSWRAGKSRRQGCNASDDGASTADADRMARMAQDGTLFIGGIHEMPLEAQGHLLRVLRRLEGSQSKVAASERMNMRVIVSTREDLQALALAGQFLHELYQRLTMVEITLPPLRERREDISQLAAYFVRREALQLGKSVEGIAEDAMKRLDAEPWPDNVRGLERALRDGVRQCKGRVLEAVDLPAFTGNSAAAEAFGMIRLQDVVEQHVLRVLKNCAGNKLRAAELLGISRSTLYRMLDSRAYGDAAMMHRRATR